MFRVLLSFLKNEGRFTAVEYGIMVALTAVAAEQMAVKI
jgi:Flp pilus assembly pilin Flp